MGAVGQENLAGAGAVIVNFWINSSRLVPPSTLLRQMRYVTAAKATLLSLDLDQFSATRTFACIPLLQGSFFDLSMVRLHNKRDDQANGTKEKAQGKSPTSTATLVRQDDAAGHAK